MQIVMTKDIFASDEIDGVTVGPQWYRKNKPYNVGERLHKTLIELGAIETVEKTETSRKRKSLKGAPENKGE